MTDIQDTQLLYRKLPANLALFTPTAPSHTWLMEINMCSTYDIHTGGWKLSREKGKGARQSFLYRLHVKTIPFWLYKL